MAGTDESKMQTDVDERIESLIRSLEDDDWRVCRDAVEALGVIGDARAVEPLIKVISISIPVSISIPAKRSGMPIRIKPAGGKKVVERGVVVVPEVEHEPLIHTHGTKDKNVRLAAINALIEIGEPAVVPLINTLNHGYLQEYVVNVLTGIGESAVEPLIKALGDEDMNVRQNAAVALGMIRDKRAVEPLKNVVGDGDKDVRLAAVRALGWIGDPSAVVHLIRATEDKDKDVRRSAAIALGEIDEMCVGLLLLRLVRLMMSGRLNLRLMRLRIRMCARTLPLRLLRLVSQQLTL
jgi:HEAT repeat protein